MNRILCFLLLLSFIQYLAGQSEHEIVIDRSSVTIIDRLLKDELKVYRGAYSFDELKGKRPVLGHLEKVEMGLRFTPLIDFDLIAEYTCSI